MNRQGTTHVAFSSNRMPHIQTKISNESRLLKINWHRSDITFAWDADFRATPWSRLTFLVSLGVIKSQHGCKWFELLFIQLSTPFFQVIGSAVHQKSISSFFEHVHYWAIPASGLIFNLQRTSQIFQRKRCARSSSL